MRRALFILILAVLFISMAEAQDYVPRPPDVSGGIPDKIVGTGGATVDVSSGNVAIAAQAGGALNVNNGPSYFPDKIDLVSQPSPILSAAGHFSLNLDAYQNLQFSVNGGAYQPALVGLPYAIPAKSANFTVDWSTVASGTLFNVTTGTSTITATFSDGATGKIIGLAKADSASGKIITSPTAAPSALSVANQGQIVWFYYDGSNYQVLSQAGIVTMDTNGNAIVSKLTVSSGTISLPNTKLYESGNFARLEPQGASAGVIIGTNLGNTYIDTVSAITMRSGGAVVGSFASSGFSCAPGVVVGSSGTQIKLIKSATATLDFGSTAAGTSSELTIALTGAVDGDDVIVSPPNAATNANSCYSARVSAADTVSVKFNNYSSGAIDPASGTFRVSLIQF